MCLIIGIRIQSRQPFEAYFPLNFYAFLELLSLVIVRAEHADGMPVEAQ